MAHHFNQDYFKLGGTATNDPDLASRSRRLLTVDEARERQHEPELMGPPPVAVPVAPSPTVKERRRAARVRRNAERHAEAASSPSESRRKGGGAARPRRRLPRGLELPTLADFALRAAVEGYLAGAHLVESLGARVRRVFTRRLVLGLRFVDARSGGRLTRLF